MLPYWFLFLIPAVLAMLESGRVRMQPGGLLEKVSIPLTWKVTFVALTLMVGWREQVGGDWFNYLRSYDDAFVGRQFVQWWSNDPGYRLLEWLALKFHWGIYGVNLLSGAFFAYGLVFFCRHMPRPWLALAVAVPYMVIITGMGYSRQGVALGCLMAGLAGLGRGRIFAFVMWTVLAATFHKSAVLILPLAALMVRQSRIITLFCVAVITGASYQIFLEESVASLQKNYLEAEYQSEGALIRLSMNAFPAALLIWKYRSFAAIMPQIRLWTWFALASLVLMGAFFVSPSSTAIDRIGLYLLPLQLVVFSYLPEAMGRQDGIKNNFWVGLIVTYYAIVEFVWLNYAIHAFAWFPYRWYPLELMKY
jgi:hypothetical protein